MGKNKCTYAPNFFALNKEIKKKENKSNKTIQEKDREKLEEKFGNKNLMILEKMLMQLNE